MKRRLKKLNYNYKIALSEVNEILKYTDDDIVSRIPKKFITFISNNMDTNHKFKVQENLELFEQPIRNETKTILAMIYRVYFCDDVEKQELIDYDKMQKDIEEKIKYEKYDPDNLFKSRKTQLDDDNKNISEPMQSIAMIKVKPKNFIQKIFDKIKRLFKIN